MWRNSRARARTMARLVVIGGLAAVVLSACGGGRANGAAPTATTTVPRSTTTASGVVAQRLNKAIGEQTSGATAAAVADFLAVVKLDPKNEIAWYDLGLIAQQENQETQAIDDYLHSLGGDPNYVPSLYNLAILETKTNPAYAEGLYERILRLQPNNAAAHLNLGFVLLNEKRPGEAKTQFTAAMHINQSLASRIPKAMGGTAA